MRRSFAGVLVLAFAGLAPAAPVPNKKLPLVTAHVQPLEKLEADAGRFVEMIGGKDAHAQYRKFMDNDYAIAVAVTGIDQKKPILAYADLNDDLARSAGTLLVPVSNEKSFLAFFQRFPENAPFKFEKVAGSEGLYEVTRAAGEFPVRVYLRFAHGYAYVGANVPPKDMDEAKLVAPADLAGKDTSLLALRLHPDRLPEARRKDLLASFDSLMDNLLAQQKAMPNVEKSGIAIAEAYAKLARRLVRQAVEETDAAAVELVADPKTREFALEIRVTPTKGGSAAKDVAARTPETSLLAGFMAKDAAATYHQASFAWRDLANGLDAMHADLKKKLADDPPPEAFRPLAEEALELYTRSLKAGKGAVSAAAYGPGPKNAFHYAAVVTVEDPSKVEKAIRTLHADPAFEAVAKAVELDAAKVGTVAVHRVKVKDLPDAPPQLPEGTACVAFAPHAVYVTYGPDSLAMIEKLMAAKPAAVKQWQAAVNPTKLTALVASFDPNAGKIAEQILGTADGLLPAFDFDVTGGTELRIRLGMHAELIPKLFVVLGTQQKGN